MGAHEQRQLAQNLDCITADLDYPMAVVTASVASRRAGCLVGFWTQCSIEPTRFLVCISRVNETHDVVLAAGRLAIHFLGEGDRQLAELFGEETGDEVDKFQIWGWHEDAGGTPLLDGCTRWVSGTILERTDVGDHTAVLVAPVAAGCGPWGGQLAFQEIRTIPPGHPVD